MPTESESFPAGPNSFTRYLETESSTHGSFSVRLSLRFSKACNLRNSPGNGKKDESVGHRDLLLYN